MCTCCLFNTFWIHCKMKVRFISFQKKGCLLDADMTNNVKLPFRNPYNVNWLTIKTSKSLSFTDASHLLVSELSNNLQFNIFLQIYSASFSLSSRPIFVSKNEMKIRIFDLAISYSQQHQITSSNLRHFRIIHSYRSLQNSLDNRSHKNGLFFFGTKNQHTN